MKKFISMVMAAAMVVSLVPATAFAANRANFKVVSIQEYTEKEGEAVKVAKDNTNVIGGAQIQLKLTDVDNNTATNDTWEVTLDLSGAELSVDLTKDTSVRATSGSETDVDIVIAEDAEAGDESVKLSVVETQPEALKDDSTLVIDMEALQLQLSRASAGSTATVEIGGDFGDSDALTFATVLKDGIKAGMKKTADVVEEGVTNMEKDLTIEPVVGKFIAGQAFELKLNGGFEFTKATASSVDDYELYVDSDSSSKAHLVWWGEDTDKITVAKGDVEIDVVSAKIGSTATITVKAIKDNAIAGTIKGTATAVDVANVIGEEVLLKVDTDEDTPVIYSGVNVNNYGITDDSDHMSLEVEVKESAKGALDAKKAIKMTLPKGVFVTNVEVTDTEGTFLYGTAEEVGTEDMAYEFAAAYKKGSHEGFEFARKTFEATDASLLPANSKDMSLKFKLELIAVPGFAGDVTLKLSGDGFEKEQEVVIAKFVSPYTVEAQSNDLIIDYRNTEVPTDVVIKEAEAGLWAKDNMTFNFSFDKDVIELEDDATVKVNAESGMELKAIKDMKFTVKEESDDEAAVVTISDISLYMGRSIAAGAYHLKMGTAAGVAMMTGLEGDTCDEESAALWTTDIGEKKNSDDSGWYFAADYEDWEYSDGEFVPKATTVKEGFVNVVTAGRDKDDASFTTKVVVPVGESYLIAGETQVALDVPAYINAAGYTMLPVRAVAKALGINNDNVIWSGEARQVTVLYGQRIITMTVGESVVYVNGSAIPASAAVEVVNGRAFLGLRDLANALGVTTIDWNSETKTATLN